MMRHSFFLSGIFAACVLAFASCKDDSKQQSGNAAQNPSPLMTVPDDHTQSNADKIRYRHLGLDLTVDFDQHRIQGTATWDIDNVKQATEAVMDANGGLAVEEVTVDGKPAQWTPANAKAPAYLGPGIRIPIRPDSRSIAIRYHTAENATALKWLTPRQTGGNKYPFLYTQSEATFARTWVPCPDGPGIRFTYDARVKVPDGLLALMSAENPQVINDSNVYHFRMENPIPAYLLALAVGDLRFRAVGANCGVYAEPDMMPRAFFELEQMPRMISAAEDLYGPYRWGRYDVLILPPSFPIGGMENPRLTFATPTIIAGDRSLVNLIAHELAHNWSGNLVTSATWDDIWMNEGFTVYLERRITERMHGPAYVDMLWELGYQDLQKEVAGMGDTSRDTWLKLDLKGRDGDDGLTDIPYEKGSLFLRLIEESVGRERWDPFLKKYFDDHAFASITTEAFVEYLRKNLIKGDSALEKKINIQGWVYGPGIPAGAPRAKGVLFARVDSARTAFLAGQTLAYPLTNKWSTHEWLHFLRGMPSPLPLPQMQRLDAAYKLTGHGNAEIADLWYTMAVRAKYTAAYGAMEEFLSRVGRRKFLEPVYGAMMETGQAALARDIFGKYRQNYHPLAQEMVEHMLAGKQ